MLKLLFNSTYLLKDFIDFYYPPVFSAIARLTRLPNRYELEELTQEVLADLWIKKDALSAESRKGIFIYKTILFHVFAYLEKKGDAERISFLKRTLPINSELLH